MHCIDVLKNEISWKYISGNFAEKEKNVYFFDVKYDSISPSPLYVKYFVYMPVYVFLLYFCSFIYNSCISP